MTFDLNYTDLHNDYEKITRIKKANPFVNGFQKHYNDLVLIYELFKLNRVYKSISKKLIKLWDKLPNMAESDLNSLQDIIVNSISDMDVINNMYNNNEISIYRESHDNFKELLFKTHSKIRKVKYTKK